MQAIADSADLDLARYPHDALSPRIWALRKNVTACDAAYLALAEALGAPLLTTDEKLARSPGHKARVEVVAAERDDFPSAMSRRRRRV